MDEGNMEMDEDIIPVYDAVEFDFDYEFDAPQFFDFTRRESSTESSLSESWFANAPDYPPSPFVAQLFRPNGLNSQHWHVSPKSKYDYSLATEDSDGDDNSGQHREYCDQDEAYIEESRQALLQKLCNGSLPNSQSQAKCFHTGLLKDMTFYNHLAHDMKNTKTKSLAKAFMRKTSTLMKPTASLLAKQNQHHQVYVSRLPKNEGVPGAHSGLESQASKRQKLDGGLLHRINNMKQPVNLIHKLPKKDATVQGMNSQKKLRITIPREPDLATAHRAERIRPNSKEMKNPTATVRRFKAQPSNEKILEESALPLRRRTTQHVPDLKVSRFRTNGNAKQHTSTAASSTICQIDKGVNKEHDDNPLETSNKDGKRIDSVGVSKGAVRQVVHSFKARPLDRKILSSRGDIGVFRSNKRDVTVPKEFELLTAKRKQHNLPIELFSKLSLADEHQPKNSMPVELPQRTPIPTKGSKENRWKPCQESHKHMKMKHQAKVRQDIPCAQERLTLANGGIVEITPHNTARRPFGGWRQ